MKKKWMALVLVTVMAMGLVGCNSSKEDEHDNVVESSQDVDADAVTESDSAESNDSVAGYPYWITQQTFGTPSTTFEGTLFNEALTIPLDITMLDSIAAPFRWWPNGVNSQDVTSIREILTSDVLLHHDGKTHFGSTGNTTSISTQIDENGQWIDEFYGLRRIYIYNFDPNGEELPLSTCYENGWWCVYEDTFSDSQFAKMLQIEEGNSVEMMEHVFAKLGNPTYIGDIFGTHNSLNEWFASMKAKDVEMYNLFWEYEDFTLQIGLQETSFGSEPSVELVRVVYHTPEFWAVQKGLMNNLFDIKSE